MKILVTGATGFIGCALTLKLAQMQHTVHALYRSQDKIKYIEHPNVKLFKGDVLDYNSLLSAAEGCQVVFHLAAFARMWAKDPDIFYRINVTGTENALRAARERNVRKFILTSTAGVFGPSFDSIITEEKERKLPYFSEYAKTKEIAEQKAREASDENFTVAMVNPTRVYGPGILSESNGVSRMVDLYLKGKFRMVPGHGKYIGNYVYIDDVVNGHILAMKKGVNNERYILGGENISFNGFFEKLGAISGNKRRMFHIPKSALYVAALFFDYRAKLFGQTPFITRKWLKRFMYNTKVSSNKAERNLNYEITPLDNGLKKTVEWLLLNKSS